MNQTLDLGHVMYFLYTIINQDENEITVSWTSYGTTICPEGGKAKLEMIFYKINDIETRGHMGTPITDDKYDHWMIIYLCCAYRLAGIYNQNQRKNTAQRFNDYLKGFACPQNVHLDGVNNLYQCWTQNENMRKLIAAIDMYLTKFHHSKYSFAKIGTMVAHHRGIGAFDDVRIILKCTGFTTIQLLNWMFDSRLKEDFERILYGNEEYQQMHNDSYFHWMMDLGMSKKSPYSPNINPAFHFWVHVFVATSSQGHGYTDSKNFKMVGQCNYQSVLENAILLAYSKLIYSNGRLFFTVDGIPFPENPKPRPLHDPKDTFPPNNHNGQEWYAWYMDKGEVPYFIKKWAAGIWKRFTNVRPGSIGEFLQNTSLSWERQSNTVNTQQ